MNIIMLSMIMMTVVAPRPMTASDLVNVKAIGGFDVHAGWVYYTLTTYSTKDNKSHPRIWMAPLDGKLKPVPFTASGRVAWGPSISPDGRWLAYLSPYKKHVQVWLAPLDGGEAQVLTRAPFDLSGPIEWSPDARTILVSAQLPIKCRDLRCVRRELKKRAKPGPSGLIFDHLFFRHWNAWRNNDMNRMLIVSVPTGRMKLFGSAPGDVPPVALGSSHDYVFSPDGRKVAFVTNADRLPAATTNNDIFFLNMKTGQVSRFTTSKGNDFAPRFSPDGRYILYLAMKRPGFEADQTNIILESTDHRTRINLTKFLDRRVYDFKVYEDWTVLFNVPDRGRLILYMIPGKKVRNMLKLKGKRLDSSLRRALVKVTSDTFITDFERIGRNRYLVKDQYIDRPAELYVMGPRRVVRPTAATPKNIRSQGLGAIAISRANDALMKNLAMGKVKEIWFTGAHGDKVHMLALLPPNYVKGRRYPAIMLIHGGPQGFFGFDFHPRWCAQMFAAPGYAVFMVNFHGSVGYGQKFTDSISGDWGGAPYQDIMKATDIAEKEPYVKPGSMCAAGASYGGYMIDWIGGHTSRYKCLITHSGVFNLESMYGSTEELWFPQWELRGTPWQNRSLYEKWSPHRYVQNWKTPTLIVHGAYDFRVTVDQSMQLFTSLKRLGVTAEFLYFPDENHFVFRPRNRILWWNTVMGWFRRWIGRGPA